MAELFIYGTLRDLDVCEAVLGRTVSPHDMRPATAPDYAVFKVANVQYPCMIPSPSAEADGAVLSHLTSDDLRRLDRFEGENYQRVPLRILCEGQAHIVDYYRPNEALETDGPWSLEQWQLDGKSQFLTLDFNLDGVRKPKDD